VKEAHRRLDNFTDDQLKQIPVLPAGSRVEQDATYIDLATSNHEEFKATSDRAAGPNSLVVPKSEVDFQSWNRLRGRDRPVPERGCSGNLNLRRNWSEDAGSPRSALPNSRMELRRH
jgi:hypothetical protein